MLVQLWLHCMYQQASWVAACIPCVATPVEAALLLHVRLFELMAAAYELAFFCVEPLAP